MCLKPWLDSGTMCPTICWDITVHMMPVDSRAVYGTVLLPALCPSHLAVQFILSNPAHNSGPSSLQGWYSIEMQTIGFSWTCHPWHCSNSPWRNGGPITKNATSLQIANGNSPGANHGPTATGSVLPSFLPSFLLILVHFANPNYTSEIFPLCHCETARPPLRGEDSLITRVVCPVHLESHQFSANGP